MRPDELVEHLRRRPFVPFRLHLTNGATYEIRHPELIKVGRSQALIFFPKQDVPHAPFTRYEAIALIHVNQLVPMDNVASGPQNDQTLSA